MSALSRTKLLLVSAKDDPEALFGHSPTSQARTYRRMMAAVHPDKYHNEPATERADAEMLYKQIGELWAKLQSRRAAKFEITTRKYTYRVNGLFMRGEIANLYHCTWLEGGVEQTGLLKMPRSVRDNDLMAREAKALQAIIKSGDPRQAFVSALVETFRHRDVSSRADRRCNVLRFEPGFVSLAQVAKVYSDGMEIRDLIWMWRRAYLALAVAHQAGIVHGAVLPEHILIHPAQHGLLLVDWCYSADASEKVPAIVSRHRAKYPQEILKKATPRPDSDIFMLSRTMEIFFNKETPKQFRSFVKATTGPLNRPDNASALCLELTALIERLYGKRKFREFYMPGDA